METHSVLWKIHGGQWSSVEVSWRPMEFLGDSVEFHGVPPNSTANFHGAPWSYSMDFSWKPMEKLHAVMSMKKEAFPLRARRGEAAA